MEILNQEKYYRILTEDLEIILDNMPLNERNGIVFQQDGATPHNAIRNREVLNGEFGENWMGTYVPILWSPRPCDLICAYIQDNVYVTAPDTAEILRNRIIIACRETPPEILLNATRSMTRRCEQCLEQNGGQFEQFR
jgi:hypothetical protein